MNLLIIGASPYQHYIYQRACELGFTVFSVDANPQAPMFAWAHHYRSIDFSDVDAVVQYAEEKDVQAVATINLDQGMLAVSRIQSQLGLPHKHLDLVRAATRKDLMREVWRRAGVNVPNYWVFESHEKKAILDLVDEVSVPLIIKPVDNAAKRGISKLRAGDSLQDQIEGAFRYSIAGRVIVEEFVEGDLYFAPTYLDDDGSAVVSLQRQTVNQQFVQLRYDAPVAINNEIQEEIISEAICAALCFGAGPYHTEIIYSSSRGPVLVETSPRVSYATVALTRLIEGFDPVTRVLADASGLALDGSLPAIDGVHFATLLHLEPEPGRIYNGRYDGLVDFASGLYEARALVPPGHVVQPFLTNEQRVMYLVTFGATYEELCEHLEEHQSWLLRECFLSDLRQE